MFKNHGQRHAQTVQRHTDVNRHMKNYFSSPLRQAKTTWREKQETTGGQEWRVRKKEPVYCWWEYKLPSFGELVWTVEIPNSPGLFLFSFPWKTTSLKQTERIPHPHALPLHLRILLSPRMVQWPPALKQWRPLWEILVSMLKVDSPWHSILSVFWSTNSKNIVTLFCLLQHGGQ